MVVGFCPFTKTKRIPYFELVLEIGCEIVVVSVYGGNNRAKRSTRFINLRYVDHLMTLSPFLGQF